MLKSILPFMLLSLSLTACQNPNQNKTDTASQTPSNQTDLDKAKSLVASVSQNKVTVEKVFEESTTKQTGLVVNLPDGRKDIAWTNKEFSLLFPQALDKTGASLNEKALTEQGVYVKAEEFAKMLEGKGFVVGKSGPIVTAFMDPNCIFCHLFYKEIMPLVKEGKVRVRFIMVGFLKPSSIPRSVAVLASADQAKALDTDEMNFNEKDEEGGLPPLKEERPDLVQKVNEDTQLMGKVGPISTPTLVACQNGTTDVSIIKGKPQDMTFFVKNLNSNSTVNLCKE